MDPTHRHSRCLPDTKKSNDLRRCGFQKTDPFLLMVNTSALGSDLHQVIYKGCNLFLSFSNDRVSGNICFKNEGVLYVTKFICSNYHLLPQEMELLINAPEFWEIYRRNCHVAPWTRLRLFREAFCVPEKRLRYHQPLGDILFATSELPKIPNVFLKRTNITVLSEFTSHECGFILHSPTTP